MGDVIIAGGGLAGLAAAAALGGAGYSVTLLESRAFLGGRATSYPVTGPGGGLETIDNCQHILLRCCTSLLDFYARLGAAERIRFHREFFFIEPGGRVSVLKSGLLPAPLHFTGAFARLRFLGLADKIAIGRALLAIGGERKRRNDLDSITMLDWLKEKRQTPAAIERFWRQILVSAINEELDRMAASHGLQVFWLGFLAGPNSYEMGVPAVPLGELYSAEAWRSLPNVRIETRKTVTSIDAEAGEVEAGGERYRGDFVICALPFERAAGLLPELGIDFSVFEHSPITGIHLWFDRPVTQLPHGTLLDRTVQWFFNKGEGRYLQLVVSASRQLTSMGRGEVIELALRELAEFLPEVRAAKLEKAHVVKEMRATFSARPGLGLLRPLAPTGYPKLFLAGDWTRSGWPATMEGAVRSGYLAAEAVTFAAGRFRTFV
ncbi:MAG: hydroxysqualene dehydroxylase HpnE [Acidobacteria bacterium]|nr:hydroxysqualene dehydroxylase HpnE [Acidobacteriota bacterium]